MTTKQEQLTALFKARSNAYIEQTNNILAELAEVFAAINEYFTEIDEIGDKRNLTWDQVGYVEQYNMIILFGAISCLPGAEIKTETGETVIITEELAPYFVRTLRVGIPINVVNDDKQAIKDFLKKRDEATASERAEAVEFLRNLLGTAEKQDEAAPAQDGFDFDTLTEEQRKGLITTAGGKPN